MAPEGLTPWGEPSALEPEVAAYFERMGAVQARWTPAALDVLTRAVDSTPRLMRRDDERPRP